MYLLHYVGMGTISEVQEKSMFYHFILSTAIYKLSLKIVITTSIYQPDSRVCFTASFYQQLHKKLIKNSNYNFNIPTKLRITVECICFFIYQISPTYFGPKLHHPQREILSLAQNYLLIVMLLHRLKSIRRIIFAHLRQKCLNQTILAF